MRTTILALALVSLAACDRGTPHPAGPARFGLANNDQAAVVSSGTQDFGKPVVGKVVRAPGGITALHIVTPLYADTTVLNGSPVAGAVVCMDPPVTGGPAPTQLCNNTATDGTVSFFYRSGTKADTFVYHANATVDGVPVQPDSARFVQGHGPASQGALVADCGGVGSAINPDTLDLTELFHDDAVRDSYGNRIAPWHLRPFAGSAKFSMSADSLKIIATSGAAGVDSAQVVADGQVVRTTHVYVHDPRLAPGSIYVYNWNAARHCANDNQFPLP